MLAHVAALLLAYLLGSVPWGLVLVRLFKGGDLRQFGSGNIGATNAMRAAGKPIGLTVFALDFLKGWVAVAGFARWVGGAGPESWLATGCGAAAVLGHCYPAWLAFRGGKGVATGCGALVAVDWRICLVGAVGWLAALAGLRMVSLASIVMGLVFPFAAWWFTAAWPPTVGSGLLAFLILVRHRSNMARIMAGTEPKAFTQRATEERRRG